MGDHRYVSWSRLAVVFSAAWLISSAADAVAGPGTYDAGKREFNLTYTYARLPGVGQVGEPLPLDPERDKIVMSFVDEVSQIFQVVTEGRGKIGSFKPVDSAARADFVISPDNDSDRAAWATMSGLGKEGHVFLYYKYLADPSRPRSGVALTAAHELCHYIFGLPDEYPDPSDGQPNRHCPPSPTGDGCIMDNYWSRPWYHKLCADDHNTTVISRRQNLRFPDSCKVKVDAFFAARGVVGVPSAEAVAGQLAAGEAGTEEAKLRTIVTTATVAVRKNAHKLSGAFDNLRRFARELVVKGLKEQNLTRTEGEISKAVGVIMKVASVATMSPPERFIAVAKILRAAAVRIAARSKAADDGAKIADVKAELINLAIKSAPPAADGGFKEEDVAYLDSLARQAVLAPPDDLQGQPKDADQVNYQMLRFLFEAVRDLSSDTNPAIARSMSDRLRSLDALGREFGLPVPNKPRFGTRRTMIIAPNPEPAFDLIPLQSGIYSYKLVRDQYLTQFAKLIQRNEIQFNKIDLRQPFQTNVDERFGAGPAPGQKPFVFTPKPDPSQSKSASPPAPAPSPTANVAQLLAVVLDEIRKDQLENVAVLIPPGGLPREVDDLLKHFREEDLVTKSDIRLDVVVVGAQKVPPLLLDLCQRSGGVVLTIADTHETGAVAQRLKNEQSAGSWIAFPRQFNLATGTPTLKLPTDKDGRDYYFNKALNTLRISQGAADANGKSPRELIEATAKQIRGQFNEISTLVKNGPAAQQTDAKTKTEPGELQGVAASIDRLQNQYEEVVNALESLDPIVTRIRSQFQEIPRIADQPLLRRLQTDSPVVLSLKKLAAQAALKDIDEAKRILHRIDREIRPTMIEELRTLNATIESSAEKSMTADRNAALKDRLKTIGDSGDTLYQAIYSALRDVERGISEVLQPINARIKLDEFQKQVVGLDHDHALAIEDEKAGADATRRLIPFFGEEGAEIEIIVGLSHIPPFGVPSKAAQFEGKELLKVQLLDDGGKQSAYGDSLKLDPVASTQTMRVYRLPKDVSGRQSQWYRLEIAPDENYAGSLLADNVRYTVSIASLRPNVQLNTGIIYEPLTASPVLTPKKIEGEAGRRPNIDRSMRGTFSALMPGPVVEVQVYGGTAILGATVKGIYQVLGGNNPLDRFPGIEFKDDGKTPDRVKDDGIYSAQIPLDATPDGGADYRLGIQAFADRRLNGRKTSNVPFEPSDEASEATAKQNAKNNQRSDLNTPQDAEALEFQRATSIHFRAEK